MCTLLFRKSPVSVQKEAIKNVYVIYIITPPGQQCIHTHDAVCGVRIRVDSRFAPRQLETALLCNDVSHWLGTSLGSALRMHTWLIEWEYVNNVTLQFFIVFYNTFWNILQCYRPCRSYCARIYWRRSGPGICVALVVGLAPRSHKITM